MRVGTIVIAGAGVAGMALALELQRRGRPVRLLRPPTSRGIASTAAAGMLAAHDPHNPAALGPLAALALDLYPHFLRHIEDRSGLRIALQTQQVLEPAADGTPGHTLLPAIDPTAGNFTTRPEHSLDPRDLYAALERAVLASGVDVHTLTAGQTPADLAANDTLVDCTGAWATPHARPSKGQMLRVALDPNLLRLSNGDLAVLRTADVYIVPRTNGSALVGATVEDRGFDLTVHDADLADLRARAAAPLPAIATAPALESWAGLRPRTADDLPILGQTAPRRFVCNGLFRNGILLAPAAAHVLAQLLANETLDVDLAPFAPDRPALAHSR